MNRRPSIEGTDLGHALRLSLQLTPLVHLNRKLLTRSHVAITVQAGHRGQPQAFPILLETPTHLLVRSRKRVF